MSELKQHALLHALILHAQAGYGKLGDPTIPEHFLAAVLASPTLPEFSQYRAQCVELVDLFSMHSAVTPQQALERLTQHFATNPTVRYSDGIYMQCILRQAQQIALEKGQEEYTAKQVLRCLLELPNECIRNILNNQDTTLSKKRTDAIRTPREIPIQEDITEPEEGTLDADDIFNLTDSAPQEPAPAPAPQEDIASLTQRMNRMQDSLLRDVFGQDKAVSVFISGLFQAELAALSGKKSPRPKASFLFAGPPGVGKTFLAEQAAAALHLPYMRFDMSEYIHHEANIEFCGSDKVYKNGKAGNVTGFVERHPKCVLLFDEIEKAHISVLHLFLQMLDVGRLRDNYTDTEVSFSDTIIFITTNAGKQLYDASETGNFSGVSRKVILRALQKDTDPAKGTPLFPAALCSRFAAGNVVMFNRITAANLQSIARREMQSHAANFQSQFNMDVAIDERVYSALLYADGGVADARTIRGRAEAFLHDELYELFRMADSKIGNAAIGKLRKVQVDVRLPKNDPQIRELFESDISPEILLLSSPENAQLCRKEAPSCHFLHATDPADALAILDRQPVKFALLDLSCGLQANSDTLLNLADASSHTRTLLRELKISYPELPVYLMFRQDQLYLSLEEYRDYISQGVREIFALDHGFADTLAQTLTQLHRQKCVAALAQANKVVSFDTAQEISPDGQEARITLFDFRTTVSVDAEDQDSLLSGVSRPDVRFDQVIGAEDAKEELRYFVDYLKDPRRYIRAGVRIPKGVLLYGPPGTGKTMLAKAMAGESNVTFLAAEGNQFLSAQVGGGVELVHNLFRTARKYAPAVLFVDEIEVIAKLRGTAGHYGEDTLTAFLTEMDGFKSDPDRPVFVLAATNYDPEPGSARSLDPAMVRRFDRSIHIGLPKREDRFLYLKEKASSNPMFALSDEKLRQIATRSTGMSMAYLESVFEMALRMALRDQRNVVNDEMFDEAFETFTSGEKKKWDLGQLERVARHESGHALLCWESNQVPAYITIVARGNHGGYVQYEDREDQLLYTVQELRQRIRVSLGGRAAEMVYYGEEAGLSTGASGDLQSATKLARQLICQYGMDPAFGMAVINPQEDPSGAMAAQIREAVNRILNEELAAAIQIIREKKAVMNALTQQLLERNHISGSQLREFFTDI